MESSVSTQDAKLGNYLTLLSTRGLQSPEAEINEIASLLDVCASENGFNYRCVTALASSQDVAELALRECQARAQTGNYSEGVRTLLTSRVALRCGPADSREPIEDINDTAVAAARRSPLLLCVLLALGADVNVADKTSGFTMLHVVAESNVVSLAKLLLDRGTDVNALDNIGSTALIYADDVEMAMLLLEHGADVNAAERDGCTALFFATMNGCFDMAKLLVRHGANVNVVEEETGETPLLFTALYGDVEAAALLLERGALVNAVENEHRQTALHRALDRGFEGLARLLVSSGADLNMKDRDGLPPTPLRRNQALVEFMHQSAASRAAFLSSPPLTSAATIWATLVSPKTATKHTAAAATTPSAILPPPTPPPAAAAAAAATAPPFLPSWLIASPAPPPPPPPPFQGCSWRHFVSAFLPPPAAAALLERIAGARADAAACLFLLCTPRVRQLTRAGALWPIRHTLRDFLVHSEPVRQLLREVEPLLLSRACEHENEKKELAAR